MTVPFPLPHTLQCSKNNNTRKLKHRPGKTLFISSLMIASLSLMNLTACSKKEEAVTEKKAPLKVVSHMVLNGHDGEYAHSGSGVGAHTTTEHANPSTMRGMPKPVIRTLSGQVVPAESTNLSFESSGKIKTVYAKLGSQVKKGTVLAEIDDTNYQLQLSQSQSQLNQAQSQYRQAQSQLNQAINRHKKSAIDVKRRENLIPIGAVSETEVDSVRLALRSAKDQVQVAKNQVQVAKDQVRVAQASAELVKKRFMDTRLTAPFTGVITAQLAEIGQLASPSVPVFTIASNNSKEVRVNVPENVLASVRVGTPMLVNFPALGQQARGKVIEVSSQASAGSFPVTIKLIKPSEHIKSGMTAEVAFQVVTADMIRRTQASNAIISKEMKNGVKPGSKLSASSEFTVPPSAVSASDNPNDPTSSFVYRIVPSKNISQSTESQSARNYAQIGKLEKVIVVIVDMAGDGMNIRGNLKAGDRIVRTGVSLLQDGQEVELMNTGTKRVNP